jgi:hypothetical protein
VEDRVGRGAGVGATGAARGRRRDEALDADPLRARRGDPFGEKAVTRWPRRAARRASSSASRPVERLPIQRTSSIGSRVPPPVTQIESTARRSPATRQRWYPISTIESIEIVPVLPACLRRRRRVHRPVAAVDRAADPLLLAGVDVRQAEGPEVARRSSSRRA